MFAILILSFCLDGTRSNITMQPPVAATQTTDFAVGRSPSAILFDGTNIWVANQLSDNLMKLSASDGSNLGTFPTGTRPVALAFDGANIWVANKFSNNVMKVRASDGVLLETIKVGRAPEALLFDGSSVWVANGGDNTVTKLRQNGPSRSPLTAITSGWLTTIVAM
jgi:DNA-binding beta-propeller fold protein YncE